jgi:hypothetical protein
MFLFKKIYLDIIFSVRSDGFTPSRGAPCQYFWSVDFMMEAEMNLTAYV